MFKIPLALSLLIVSDSVYAGKNRRRNKNNDRTVVIEEFEGAKSGTVLLEKVVTQKKETPSFFKSYRTYRRTVKICKTEGRDTSFMSNPYESKEYLFTPKENNIIQLSTTEKEFKKFQSQDKRLNQV